APRQRIGGRPLAGARDPIPREQAVATRVGRRPRPRPSASRDDPWSTPRSDRALDRRHPARMARGRRRAADRAPEALLIASPRGLTVLGGVAALLLVVVLIDRPQGHVAVDRALVPGFDAERVVALELSGLPITRAGASWRLPDGPADTMTVDAM